MNEVFPLWAAFGLGTALLTTVTFLMQEKLRINGYAMAFWNKVACVGVTLPFILIHGLPPEPLFYAFMVLSAVLYAVSDVVLFKAIPDIGAGVASRLLPASVIFSFLLWFAIDPQSLARYMAAPEISLAIFGVLCLWVYFATHLRRCAVSMAAARRIWFCIFAAIIGPVVAKEIFNTTDLMRGVYGFPFVQALMMLAMWSGYFIVKKPVSRGVLFSATALRPALVIGAINAFSVICSAAAISHVDNPAYVSAVAFLNAFFILLAYAAWGRKNDGNVTAGIGMVVCAAVLIVLKAQIP